MKTTTMRAVKFPKQTIAILITLATICIGCEKHDFEIPQITMTTLSSSVRIGLAGYGFGTASIDWGDGTEPEIIKFRSIESPLDWGNGSEPEIATLRFNDSSSREDNYYMDYHHSYFDEFAHEIVIKGNITLLVCGYEGLTNLDVDNCPCLITLNCCGSQLSNLNLNRNVMLKYLNCAENQLTKLSVGFNPVLELLDCPNNQLTNLSVDLNTALQRLDCSNNQLTNLSVNLNTALQELDCSNNQLTHLDVSNNTALFWLNCGGNNLTASELNYLFRTLPPRNNHYRSIHYPKYNISEYNINIHNNPGTADCDETIAADKGWCVLW